MSTVLEFREIAKGRGLTGYSKLNKAELESLLRATESTDVPASQVDDLEAYVAEFSETDSEFREALVKIQTVEGEASSYSKQMLGWLQSKSIYGGTVDPEVVRDRRRKNKLARRARKINQRRNQHR